MTQNPSDKPSNDPAPGAMPGGDIDEILAQASGLADELAGEVGVSRPAPSAEENVASPDVSRPESEAIDAQLDQIERSLSQTESEVAGTGGRDKPAGGELDYKAAAAAFGDASGDPTEPETAEPSSLDQPPSAGGKSPGGKVIQLGKRKSDKPPASDTIDSPGIELSEQDLNALSDGGSCPTLDDSPDCGPKPTRSQKPSATPTADEEAMYLPASVGAVCATLDILDRPFHRLGWRPRRLVGWLALAILFAAFVVFVLSFFQ